MARLHREEQDAVDDFLLQLFEQKKHEYDICAFEIADALQLSAPGVSGYLRRRQTIVKKSLGITYRTEYLKRPYTDSKISTVIFHIRSSVSVRERIPERIPGRGLAP